MTTFTIEKHDNGHIIYENGKDIMWVIGGRNTAIDEIKIYIKEKNIKKYKIQ